MSPVRTLDQSSKLRNVLYEIRGAALAEADRLEQEAELEAALEAASTALEETVTEMERRAADGEYAPEADWRFHETLYRRLDNDFVLELIRVFWRVFHSLDARLPRGDGTPRVTAAWHRDILEALRGKDEPALAAAMEAHFDGIRSRVEE